MSDIQEFNKRAMQCPNHRMIASVESIYKKYDYQQSVPEKEIITYKCVGECKQELQQIITQKVN